MTPGLIELLEKREDVAVTVQFVLEWLAETPADWVRLGYNLVQARDVVGQEPLDPSLVGDPMKRPVPSAAIVVSGR